MVEQPYKFPDNPNHANGTCEDCGEPCHVYGCRWCPACYDAGSARIRAARRVQSANEWAATSKPLSAAPVVDAPVEWQRAALQSLGFASSAVLGALPWAKAQAFAVTAEEVLRSIRRVCPELDLEPIKAWANAQAQASADNDALVYLDLARRAVVSGEPLPWLPVPSGLTPSVTHNEPS